MHRRRRQGTHGQWSPWHFLSVSHAAYEEEAPITEDGDGGEDIRAEVDLTRDIVGRYQGLGFRV